MQAEEKFWLAEEQKEEKFYQHRSLGSGLFFLRKSMRFSESLKKNVDFQKVYKKGKSYTNRYLTMLVIKNDLNRNRIGISVSKKVGNSIVRHRITRLIRESYRLNEEDFKCGFDLVIVARMNAKGKNYFDIEEALMHLARLHKIAGQ